MSCFTGSMCLPIPNHSLQTSGSPEVLTSTTVLGNVVQDQLGKAGVPHPGLPYTNSLIPNCNSMEIETGCCKDIILFKVM